MGQIAGGQRPAGAISSGVPTPLPQESVGLRLIGFDGSKRLPLLEFTATISAFYAVRVILVARLPQASGQGSENHSGAAAVELKSRSLPLHSGRVRWKETAVQMIASESGVSRRVFHGSSQCCRRRLPTPNARRCSVHSASFGDRSRLLQQPRASTAFQTDTSASCCAQ
jgi:hypothetical protein